MSHTKFFYLLLAILVLLSVLFTVVPAKSLSAERLNLQKVDKDKIDAYIQSRMEVANIPGLALGVIDGDQAIYLKGYGIAGPDGRAVTPQTPFILGSTSKSITALAVMQLVEAGKIDLDAPVTKYLPWFRTTDPAVSSQITVRHLLNQNSGLPTYEGRLGLLENDTSSTALENGVRHLADVQLSQPAGQVYEYANENYNILGLIVQTVSANSYEDYIRSAIFAPLQMSHSAAALSDSTAKDIANGYRYWLFWSIPFDAPYPRRMTPSGFLIASAEDMTHYLSAQLNGGTYGKTQILSAQGIATLHSPGSKIGPSSSYGMGWVIQGQGGSTEFWHNGDTSNFHSNLLLLPDQHIGIVILINVSEFNNSTAVNIPIEGVAAILLGHNLSVRTDPPSDLIAHVMPLLPLLIVVGWIAGSYLFIKRWQRRGELPVHGIRRVWRYFLPLGVDLGLAALAWVVVPPRFQTPMETVSLFAPDLFLMILLITLLSLGWAVTRTFLTLRPPHVAQRSNS